MKAVVVKEVGVLEVQDVPEPEPEPDQIKVKIAYAGICGSGCLKSLQGHSETGCQPRGCHRMGLKKLPRCATRMIKILGHEASGTIVKIGKDIKGDFKVGQHVAMNFRSTCGACYYCTNGMAHFCER